MYNIRVEYIYIYVSQNGGGVTPFWETMGNHTHKMVLISNRLSLAKVLRAFWRSRSQRFVAASGATRTRSMPRPWMMKRI